MRNLIFIAIIFYFVGCLQFPKAIFEEPRPKVLYKNWDDILPYPVNAAQFDSIYYETDKGIINVNGQNASILVSEKGHVTVKVYGKKGGRKRLIFTQHYRVSQLPYPEASLINVGLNHVYPSFLYSAELLHANLRISNIETFAIINDFEVYLLSNTTSSTVRLKNYGAEFQPETRALLSKAQPGDLVLFYNIRCYYKGDIDTMVINPYVVKVLSPL